NRAHPMLARHLLGYLGQGDVGRLLDLPENEGLVRIELRARWLALLAGDRLAVAPVPVPRRCTPDPDRARRLPRRKAFRYRRNHPAAKVRTQAASHPHLPANYREMNQTSATP